MVLSMNVIRRLRRKFILISTTTVIIIVVGVLGLVNTIAYMRVYTHIEIKFNVFSTK